MSRALVVCLALLWLLGGCAGLREESSVAPAKPADPEIIEHSVLQKWLRMSQHVSDMSPERARAVLSRRKEPEKPRAKFYYALLSQHTQSYDGWTKARDLFRVLRKDRSITAEQQQLAGMLEDYNQLRINWYQRHGKLQRDYAELQTQLLESEDKRSELEQKIQALTDLEEAMSTRKEQ